MGKGRSLFDDPEFKRLAREYEAGVPSGSRPVAGVDDAINGRWHVIEMMSGHERVAIERVADYTRLGVYLPL